MNFKGFFDWITALQLNWWQSLIFLIVIFLGASLMLLIKDKKIDIKSIFKRKNKSVIRCVDCIQILNSKTQEIEVAKREAIRECDRLENSILRKEMNFAEGKISEIEDKFIGFYNKLISVSIETGAVGTEVREYRMYWGLVKSAIRTIKDKFRYSFKENGFHTLSGNDFSSFAKNKTKGVIGVFDQEIINLYPSTEKTIVKLGKILKFIEDTTPIIEDIVFEIYINAKKVNTDINNEIKIVNTKYDKLHKDYKNELESFIKQLEERNQS